ncbi:MAG: hypothetical protein H6815_04500 [Phycisphaeraceae bacterium]|nr:hypothetical protein [Phycisphaerales bacterium]MCB9859693.1 hypothetical protein [Phycisphaeraceae bacterium]
MTHSKLALTLAVFGCATAVSAQVYTDRASFLAAASSSQLDDVESYPVIGDPSGGAVPSFNANMFAMATSPTAIKIQDAAAFGAFNTTPGGVKYFYLDTDQGNVGTMLTLTANGADTWTAIGFDYTDMDSVPLTIFINGQAYTAGPSGNNASAFIGIVSSTPFTSVSIDSGSDSGWGMDDVLVQMDGGCYADCDGSGTLNIFDYICFGNEYSAGTSYADCDSSGSLNIFDYICYGNEYSAGCP